MNKEQLIQNNLGIQIGNLSLNNAELSAEITLLREYIKELEKENHSLRDEVVSKQNKIDILENSKENILEDKEIING